jgi:hypothetical protein
MTARTYTPGYTAAKVVLIGAGLLVAALGGAQLAAPLHATFAGTRVSAEVVRVVKTKPGLPDEIYTTPQAIPADTNRSARFRAYVELPAAGGTPQVAELGVGRQLRPSYVVGDTVVVAFHGAQPALVHVVYDLATWTAGGFLLLGGLVFAGAFAHLALRSRRPIAVPDDIPADAVL